MVANDRTWKRARATVTPAGGWQPVPGARVRPDAEVPAQWRPFSLLIPRLHVVRHILAQTLQTLTGRPAGKPTE